MSHSAASILLLLPFQSLIRFLDPQNRPVVVSHIHTDDWLFDWWYLQALPRHTSVYDLARKSCVSRALQHVACPGDFGQPYPWWHFPPALFWLHYYRLLLLQSVLFLLGKWSFSSGPNLLLL